MFILLWNGIAESDKGKLNETKDEKEKNEPVGLPAKSSQSDSLINKTSEVNTSSCLISFAEVGSREVVMLTSRSYFCI